MDGCAGQYCAHIEFQESRVDLVRSLGNAVSSLLEAFHQKNNSFPANIVVYRDGVGDGDFAKVLLEELPPLQAAIAHCLAFHGYLRETIHVAIVVCQKRHNSRFVFKDGSEFVNLCPGVCVDSNSTMNAVVSAVVNEFYLNSHTAIQGTSKPCKYSLLFDEIGFKVCVYIQFYFSSISVYMFQKQFNFVEIFFSYHMDFFHYFFSVFLFLFFISILFFLVNSSSFVLFCKS